MVLISLNTQVGLSHAEDFYRLLGCMPLSVISGFRSLPTNHNVPDEVGINGRPRGREAIMVLGHVYTMSGRKTIQWVTTPMTLRPHPQIYLPITDVMPVWNETVGLKWS